MTLFANAAASGCSRDSPPNTRAPDGLARWPATRRTIVGTCSR
jgi:hypothetical protein